MATYIVTGSTAQNRVRYIPGFKMDLGMGVMNADTVTFYDNVVKSHAEQYGRLIHMYGKIGSLAFYTDTTYSPTTVSVFANNKSYTEDLNWSDGAILEVIEGFLSRAKEQMEQPDNKEEEKKVDAQDRVRIAREAAAKRREEKNTEENLRH